MNTVFSNSSRTIWLLWISGVDYNSLKYISAKYKLHKNLTAEHNKLAKKKLTTTENI